MIIDISQPMQATDVDPNRLKATKEFTSRLTPGINLGLIGFMGTLTADAPTPRHHATIDGLQNFQFGHGTATGRAT